MTRAPLLLLLASGCFYTDPINQRPSADIIQNTSDTIYRGSTLSLDASTNDPEGEAVEVKWRAYACTDATTAAGCDQAPFYTGALAHADIPVPILRADMITPVQALLVPVADHPPVLTLRKDSSHGFVVDTPISLYAQVADPDDGAAAVKPLDWQVFSPSTQPGFDLVDKGALATDPTQFWQVFTPHGIGDWDIQVTATDPIGAQDVEHLAITVVADHPPCLAQWSPAAPPPGDALPMSDPTLFEILVVNDDLDPYPPVAGGGNETFAWSLLPPGATQRQALVVAGNHVELDPASYQPGDVLELRVEVQDRKHTPVSCPDSDPTCSVISDPQCIQRLTWRVEVQ